MVASAEAAEAAGLFAHIPILSNEFMAIYSSNLVADRIPPQSRRRGVVEFGFTFSLSLSAVLRLMLSILAAALLVCLPRQCAAVSTQQSAIAVPPQKMR